MNLIKTILPNQLVQNGNFESASGWSATRGTISVANNICTFTANEIGGSVNDCRIYPSSSFNMVVGHKYLMSYWIKLTRTTVALIRTYPDFDGATTPVQANTWTLVSSIYTMPQTANETLWLSLGMTSGNGFAVGDVAQIRNAMLIDLTEEGSGITTVSGFKAKYPLPYYPYRTTTVNALVTANNAPITADISSMLPSGIGVVDLGSLNWLYDATDACFEYFSNGSPLYIEEVDYNKQPYFICSKYLPLAFSGWGNVSDNTMGFSNTHWLYVKDTSFNGNATAFKNANKGVLLFYKKTI